MNPELILFFLSPIARTPSLKEKGRANKGATTMTTRSENV